MTSKCILFPQFQGSNGFIMYLNVYFSFKYTHLFSLHSFTHLETLEANAKMFSFYSVCLPRRRDTVIRMPFIIYYSKVSLLPSGWNARTPVKPNKSWLAN